MSKCLYCLQGLPSDCLQEYHTDCARKFFGVALPSEFPFGLSEMPELAQSLIDQSVAVSGVQPKISLGLMEGEIKYNQAGRTMLDVLGDHFILKPPNEAIPMMPENEHVTMCLAKSFNISVVPSTLMRLKSGELCYVTRRVDRSATGEMIHMIDYLQILGLGDKYTGTMEQLGKKIGELSCQGQLDKFRFFELAVFNFLIGNNDMHLKNFSMLLTDSGWRLSPAYDLLNVKIILPGDKEDLALKLGGKKLNHNLGYFERFALVLGLNTMQVKTVLNRIITWLPTAESLIRQSFLPPDLQEAYLDVLNERVKRLGL